MTSVSYHTQRRDLQAQEAARATLALTAAGALCGLDAGSFGPMLPALRAGLALDDRRAAWVLSAYVLGAIYGAPWAARSAATFGAARTLVGALSVASAGAWLSAAARDVVGACAGRALFGVGGAAVLPIATAAVTARVPTERRGRAVVTLSLAYGAAFLASTAAASAAGAVAWRAVYGLLGVAALLVAAVVARAVTDVDARTTTPQPLDRAGVALWTLAVAALAVVVPRLRGASGSAAVLAAAAVTALGALGATAWRAGTTGTFVPLGALREPGVRGASLVAFGMGAGQVFAVSIPSFAAAVLGVAPSRVGLWSLPFVLAGLVGTALAMVSIDRMGARRMTALTGVALVVGAAALALLPASGVGFAVASAVTGAGLCTLSAGPVRRLVSVHGEAEAARAQALLALVANLGLLAGSALYGVTVSPRAEPALRAAGMRDATLAVAGLVAVMLGAGAVALRRERG
ncbi:MAG: MFS transporter [Polyangiales bacterium]